LLLTQAAVIGFIPVTDFDLAEAFYCGKLGFAAVRRDDFALVVEAARGMMIRCVKMPEFQPQPFTILGWEMDDLAGAADGLVGAGIAPLRFSWFEQDERGIWTAPDGTGVLWFKDPFGNTLSLSRHAIGVPAR
jgi:catechol 2,3-dioxygenase-like lactoylglutathione lyase family enzyme